MTTTTLAPLTTLGIGGDARRFTRVTTRAELTDALRTDDPVLILGGGSNLVVRDGGWNGLVIQIGMTGVTFTDQRDDVLVTAAAGVPWDDLVANTVSSGLAGLECMSGIPGLVGATPMQNVGAYGQEVADTIEHVRAIDRTTGDEVLLAPADCGFGYRTSKFKGRDRWVITEVAFALQPLSCGMPIRYPELARALAIPDGGRAPLAETRRVVIELRRGKGMVVDPADPESRSAGSFFTNPIVDSAQVAAIDPAVPRYPQPDGRVKLAAGWLIEHAGFAKGTARGRVAISAKHALALVNRGGATAAELLALAAEIQAGVRAKFGVALELEPVVVGQSGG